MFSEAFSVASALYDENATSSDGSLRRHSTRETGRHVNLTSDGFTMMYTTTSMGKEVA